MVRRTGISNRTSKPSLPGWKTWTATTRTAASLCLSNPTGRFSEKSCWPQRSTSDADCGTPGLHPHVFRVERASHRLVRCAMDDGAGVGEEGEGVAVDLEAEEVGVHGDGARGGQALGDA